MAVGWLDSYICWDMHWWEWGWVHPKANVRVGYKDWLVARLGQFYWQLPWKDAYPDILRHIQKAGQPTPLIHQRTSSTSSKGEKIGELDNTVGQVLQQVPIRPWTYWNTHGHIGIRSNFLALTQQSQQHLRAIESTKDILLTLPIKVPGTSRDHLFHQVVVESDSREPHSTKRQLKLRKELTKSQNMTSVCKNQ